MTEIESHVECDTFIPAVDLSVYQPWYMSSPVVENSIRYFFVTFVRLKMSTMGPTNSSLEVSYTGSVLDFKKFKYSNFNFLPKTIFEKHEEFLYLKLVQDIISNGNDKGDQMGTGTLSKFGCQVNNKLYRHWCYECMDSWLKFVDDRYRTSNAYAIHFSDAL